MRSYWALVIFNRNHIGSSIVFLIRRLTSTQLAFVSFKLEKSAKIRERGGRGRKEGIGVSKREKIRKRAQMDDEFDRGTKCHCSIIKRIYI